MAIYGQFNNRGPQVGAQERYAARFSANNGDPGGANNVSPTAYKPGMPASSPSQPQAPTNPQTFMSDYAIRQGGQRPELARYVAPQLDVTGNPVGRDVGGYSYNVPNSFGHGGLNRQYPGHGGSVFNPYNQPRQRGGGGMQDILARIRGRLQQEPTGMPRTQQPGANDNMGVMGGGAGYWGPGGLHEDQQRRANDYARQQQLNNPDVFGQADYAAMFAQMSGQMPQGGPGTMQPFNSGMGPQAPGPFNSGYGPQAPQPTSFKPGMPAPVPAQVNRPITIGGPSASNPGFRDPVNNPVPGGT